jgi:hypothetical protein
MVRAVLAASCLIVSTTATAVVVGRHVLDDDPTGSAVDALMNGFRFHGDALSARFIDRANQGVVPATVQSWRAFEQRMTDSTFVTLFYTYQGRDGISRSRTYYAMSGSRGTVDSGPESLLTPDQHDWLDPWPGEVLATSQDEARTRVPWQMPTIRPDAPWDLQDAEMKAVRTLEKDLVDGAVEKGGFATVFVSNSLCLACDQALNNFANAYELSLVAKENASDGSQTNQVFRARQRVYLTTVRSSLTGRSRFRPREAPPARGNIPDMCVIGRPVVAFPVARRLPSQSALTTLIRAYARLDGDASYVLSGNGETYARWVLADPSSPYSAQAERSLSPMNDAERLAARLLAVAGSEPSQRELSRRKQHELGFSKSRQGADVDATIMHQVRDMAGDDYPAIGALYAVAAQILRERLKAVPVDEQRRVGLRPDILGHLESTQHPWRPSDFDRQYLAVLIDGAMREWDIKAPGSDSVSGLPLPFRIARTAAAYRDRQPFDADPCLETRKHNPATAGKGGSDHRPLCFDDATDRAVYEWFVTELQHETAVSRPTEIGDPHRERIAGPFRYTQFGPPSLDDGSLGAAVTQEVVEMKIVNRLVADGDLSHEASLPVIQRAVNRLKPKRN